MLTRIHHIVERFKPSYTSILSIAGGQGVAAFASALFFMYIPILLATEYNETIAGILIGIVLLMSVLVFPISGEIANRRGSLRVIRCYPLFFIVGSLIRLLFPTRGRTLPFVLIFSALGLGCNLIQCYVLETAPKNEGGMVFGLVQSIVAIGTLAGTLVFPYFETIPYPALPIFIIVSMSLLLGVTFRLPKTPTDSSGDSFRSNLGITHIKEYIRKGHAFIQKNNQYPLFFLSVRLFEGIFYGTVRFLFPLYLVHERSGVSWTEGLTLGIYELVTILFGGICGLLADKYGRKPINIIGRSMIMLGVILMLIQTSLIAIILLGVLIGFGNNLIFGSAAHILEEMDEDHQEDGSFIALERIVLYTGYVAMPIILGILYARGGFYYAFSLMTVVVCALSVCMIQWTVRK